MMGNKQFHRGLLDVMASRISPIFEKNLNISGNYGIFAQFIDKGPGSEVNRKLRLYRSEKNLSFEKKTC